MASSVDDKLRPPSWVEYGLLFGLGLLYYMPMAAIDLDPYDEAIRLVGAERVLAGEVPYHDFYAMYGPAQFYVPAALLYFFGAQVLTLRIALVLVNALAAIALYGFCRTAGLGLRGALLVYLLFLLPRAGTGAQLYACGPALALLWFIGGHLASGREALTAGLLLGIVSLFRHDFGLYGTFASVAAILAARPATRAIALHHLARLGLGIMAVSGVGYGLLALRGVRPLYDCLIRYPAVHMPFRRLPYPVVAILRTLVSPPWPLALVVYLAPPVAVGLLSLLVSRDVRARLFGPTRSRVALVYALTLALGLAVYGFARCDFAHLFAPYTACVVLGAILVHAHLEPASPRITSASVAVVIVVTGLAFVGMLLTYSRGRPVPLDRAAGIIEVQPDWRALPAAVSDLRACGSGPTFVACDRNDRAFVNPLILYFLTGRCPGVYFAQFDPGITTTDWAQRRTIAELERNRVGCVITWRVELPDEPNLSRTVGARLLDDFLRERCTVVKREEWYSLLRGGIDPAAAP